MLSKRSIIGLVVGGAITAIGLYALVGSLGIQTIDVDDTVDLGDSTSFSINAPVGSEQRLNVTGTSFDLTLSTPRGGLQIPGESYKNELSLQWSHLMDGESNIRIQNTGDSELQVSGSFEFITEFIQITYHIMVITAGLVIIGFSAAFSVRKPRGF